MIALATSVVSGACKISAFGPLPVIFSWNMPSACTTELALP